MYINGRFLTQKITGVQRFAYEIINELNQHKDLINKYNIKLVVPEYYNDFEYPFNNIPLIKKGNIKGHLWEQLILSRISREELLLNLCNTGPILKRNQVTIIHDVAVYANPNTFSKAFRIWYKIMFKAMAIFTKKIVTISKFSKSELIKYLSIPEERLGIISEGKEQILRIKPDYSILNRYKLKNKSYLLAVGSLNPNKNFNAIIKAAKSLPKNLKLVIAGGSNSKVFRSDLKQSEVDAIFVGYITDEELKALYENAFCFIYPSFYEGFGLPPLEAMACGCPVISSNTSSLPEICNDAVIYIDPYQPQQIVEQINRMLLDPSLRNEIIIKGLKQAEKFSWKKALQELFWYIEEVLAK